jgi:hypothetical protein
MKSEILIDSGMRFVSELGKPLDLIVKLKKKFDHVTVSIGYYVNGKEESERVVPFYENYSDADTLVIESVLDEYAAPTYKGKLIEVNWFITFEADDITESFAFTAYPLHYHKHRGVKA